MKFITSSLCALIIAQSACAQELADRPAVRRLRTHKLLEVEDKLPVSTLERSFADKELLSRLLQDGSMSM